MAGRVFRFFLAFLVFLSRGSVCSGCLGLACRRGAPPGFAGCAPCRLCRHGHSAPIPHAFAPAALRASLASGGKPCGLSPPRRLGAPGTPPIRL